MITDGHWKIVGSGMSLYTFLVNTYPKIKRQFYCEKQSARINEVFNDFMLNMKKISTYLVQSIVQNKVSKNPRKPKRDKLQKILGEYDACLLEFEINL